MCWWSEWSWERKDIVLEDDKKDERRNKPFAVGESGNRAVELIEHNGKLLC